MREPPSRIAGTYRLYPSLHGSAQTCSFLRAQPFDRMLDLRPGRLDRAHVRLGAKLAEDKLAIGISDGGLPATPMGLVGWLAGLSEVPDEAFDRCPVDSEALGDVALRAFSGVEGRENALAEIHRKRSRHGSGQEGGVWENSRFDPASDRKLYSSQSRTAKVYYG